MADSINEINLDFVRDHIQTVSDQVMLDIKAGFSSQNFFDLETDIKGSHVLTSMEVEGNMVSNYRHDLVENPDAFKFNPRVIETHLADWQFGLHPKTFYKSYLGAMYKRGQNADDLPFLSYCLEGAINKAKSELNTAAWYGERDATVTGNFMKVADGFATILGKMKTAGTLTETVLPAPSQSNLIEQVKTLWKTLDANAKAGDLYLHLSSDLALEFEEAWFEKFKSSVAAGGNPYKTMKITLAPHEGLTGDEMMLTSTKNLVYAVDSIADIEKINVRESGKGYKYWSDFMFGFQIRDIRPTKMAVNSAWQAV